MLRRVPVVLHRAYTVTRTGGRSGSRYFGRVSLVSAGRRAYSSARTSTPEGFPQPSPGQVFGGLGVLFAAYTIGESFFAVDAGKVYVCQNNLSGTLEVHTQQGMQRRTPYFSKLTAYDKLVSIDTFRSEDDGGKPVRCTFADTYAGTVPVTFRFRLPSTESEIRKLHMEFGSMYNLERETDTEPAGLFLKSLCWLRYA
eukprot:COSAG02_NODE_3855_length_6141_cov_16.381000_2_plen_198_part_00